MSTATEFRNDDDAVKAIRRVVTAAYSFQSRGTKTNERYLKIAVRDALRPILGRKPTDEEVERAIA